MTLELHTNSMKITTSHHIDKMKITPNLHISRFKDKPKSPHRLHEFNFRFLHKQQEPRPDPHINRNPNLRSAGF